MRAVCDEQPRLPLSYFEQHIPVPGGWDAGIGCGYLMFAPPGQDRDDDKARERGWRVERLPCRHLHQLVDPDAVATAMERLAGSAWSTAR
ncbi:hypothetical protein [Micromonospora sp. LOL_024]|uniref:hypothetical protein n=1 Tax=Micromonospora sp. LOL_024 TaxID=3345412 RepID=UPI003A851175